MNTLSCKNKNHVIKEVYSLKDTTVPFYRVADVLGVVPGPVSMSAALYWLFAGTLEWCVEAAMIRSVNDIPDFICSSCVSPCRNG